MKEETITKLIDKIAWLYIENGKVLSTRSKGKDALYFPGGKREANETDMDTLVREIKEELSVDIITETAVLYGIFEAQAHGKAEGVKVKMTCYTALYEGSLNPDNEIAEIHWITFDDYDRVSPVDKLILDDLKRRELI